jgi:hypothetical protein
VRDELAGSRHLALTLALLLGTFLITRGYMRAGCLYLACLQIPAGAYDVATGQYGFVLMSLVGGVLYLRGWRRKDARESRSRVCFGAARSSPNRSRTGGSPGTLMQEQPRGPECRAPTRAQLGHLRPNVHMHHTLLSADSVTRPRMSWRAGAVEAIGR